jgi:hypothetical protein
MNVDVEFQCHGDIPTAVPDGDHYEAIFIKAERSSFKTQQKLYLWFEIITPGDFFGQTFFMPFNVPPKEKWTASSKYWKTWVFVANRRPTRADRMTTRIFRGRVFRVRMRIVCKSADQRERTPAQQYSVVDEILEVKTGQCV